MRLFLSLHIIILLSVWPAGFASAATNATAPEVYILPEITVTAKGMRYSRPAGNVEVIAAEEIAASGAAGLGELLEDRAGLVLRGYTGHDKRAVPDIRGMGDAGVSNVLVLVDSMRLNPPDMAGPDLSTVPLSEVERIEIRRGASSVLYGDGAVGGVVDIITRKGYRDQETKVGMRAGSFQTLSGQARTAAGGDDFTIRAGGDFYDSDGFRDNGEYSRRQLSASAVYDPSDELSMRFSAAMHKDRYGLPGPVSAQAADSEEERKKTNRPDDRGETLEHRFGLSTQSDLTENGRLSVSMLLRLRSNDYIMGYTPLLSRDAQTDEIGERTSQFNIKYETEVGKHSLLTGVDAFFTDYERLERSKNMRTQTHPAGLGVYVHDSMELEPWRVQTGYRFQVQRADIRRNGYGDVGADFGRMNEDHLYTFHAAHLGAERDLNPQTLLYASLSSAFRAPNADEFALAAEDLKPQNSLQLEVGGRGSILGIDYESTMFGMVTEDEIYYGEDPSTGATYNRNYEDRTLRLGWETSLSAGLGEDLDLWGNYTFLEARFQDKETTIPLVPRHKLSVGAIWEPAEALRLSADATFTGERYDGNDPDNDRYETLAAYTVFNCRAEYAFGDLNVYAGVNNIFNELYSASAYSESHYPMPGRNWYAGFEWTFE